MNWQRNKESYLFCITVLIGLATFAIFCPVAVADQAPPSVTSISCSVSVSSFPLGNSVTVSGSISPAVPNATVTLTYTKPGAATITRTAMTGTDGSYSDAYTPDMAGSWAVRASWAGNDNFLAASSFDTQFTVNSSSTTSYTYVYIVVIAVVIVVVALAVLLSRRKKQL
jgi:hypothetical protein